MTPRPEIEDLAKRIMGLSTIDTMRLMKLLRGWRGFGESGVREPVPSGQPPSLSTEAAPPPDLSESLE